MHAESFITRDPLDSPFAADDRDALPALPPGVPAWLRAFVAEAMRAAAPPTYLRWIRAGVGSAVRLVDVDRVLFFHADTKYTAVVMPDAEWLIRTPLRELRRELDPATWWTIHRSTIVNVRAIDEVRRRCDGRVVVQVAGRAELLRVSEAHERQFRQM